MTTVLTQRSDRALAARALESLCDKGADAYLDQLWLCFGDSWTKVRDELSRMGLTSGTATRPRPTPKTKTWIALSTSD